MKFEVGDVAQCSLGIAGRIKSIQTQKFGENMSRPLYVGERLDNGNPWSTVVPRPLSNGDFVYEGPGYFVDRCGERWLVGEDPDGDLVGINILSPDPIVQYWDPGGRVRCGVAEQHARDLTGPLFARSKA